MCTSGVWGGGWRGRGIGLRRPSAIATRYNQPNERVRIKAYLNTTANNGDVCPKGASTPVTGKLLIRWKVTLIISTETNDWSLLMERFAKV